MENGRSIYEAVLKMIDPVTGRITPDQEELPDNASYFENTKIKLASGAFDGMYIHHMGREDETANTNRVYKLLSRVCRNPSEKLKFDLFNVLKEIQIITIADQLLQMICEKREIDAEKLYQLAIYMVKQGTHRNIVKLGISILGLFELENEIKDLLFTLGKHNEFTLFAAAAMKDNGKLFQLAKYVEDWGRIHIVERINADTEEIKDWLLREGYQCFLNEYLAYVCAMKGELHLNIHKAESDDGLFRSVGQIIVALLNGGPAEDIDDYPYSSIVIPAFLNIAERKYILESLISVHAIKDYLSSGEDIWEERCRNGWAPRLRQDCLVLAQSIVEKDVWEAIIKETLISGRPTDKCLASEAAEKQNVDVWELLFAQLALDPANVNYYRSLAKTDDKERIIKLVDFLSSNLPLNELSIGPADESWVGEKISLYECLSTVLISLDRFEGIGTNLIETALWSPVTQIRNMALSALEGWSRQAWTPRIRELMEKLKQVEPDKNTKKRLKELLAKK